MNMKKISKKATAKTNLQNWREKNKNRVKKYKLIDKQGAGCFLKVVFDSKEQIRKQLISFHSADCDEDSLKRMSLNELLDFGEWSIKQIWGLNNGISQTTYN